MKGKVKFYNISKRFGFITAEDGTDYFVHQSGLNEGVRIREDDAVTFDTDEGERGPKAINVSLDGESSSSSEEDASGNDYSEEEEQDDSSSDDDFE